MLYIAAAVVFVFTGISAVLGACPHKLDGLVNWSAESTWDGMGVPQKGDSVNVTKSVLMDVTRLTLFNIVISPGARLVFHPNKSYRIRVSHIIVEGEMHIGTRTCPQRKPITITLTGKRGDYMLMEGEKAILVREGGILEMHGARKTSWTKLDGTLHKLSETDDVLYDHQHSDRKDMLPWVAGLVAYVVRLTSNLTVDILDFGVFDISRNGSALVNMIQGVQDGDIFMMATNRFVELHDTMEPQQGAVYDAVELLLYDKITGTGPLRTVDPHAGTYALVYQKGNWHSVRQSSPPLGKDARATFVLGDEIDGRVFTAVTNGDANIYAQMDNFHVRKYNGYRPLINVIDDVTTWNAGDKVVFASTDYDYQQAEEIKVVFCKTCSNHQFRIARPPAYTHFGEFVHEAIDMRGEVGLLTRNVLIQGGMQVGCPAGNENCEDYPNTDTFGGHIKVLRGFHTVNIEGVELYHMGQQTDKGRYPIHFHMCFNRTESETIPVINDVSIHHTFARCFTTHGSHKVQVLNTVCYKAMGHAYFLEEGGEWNTKLDGNLAISTLRGSGKLEPEDEMRPTSFWITNPNTWFTNNVAAGGQFNGIWFVYPDEPLGHSRNHSLMQHGEASRTPIWQFGNNVAHSYQSNGIRIGSRLTDNSTITHSNHWQPRSVPTDPDSTPLVFPLTRMTGYKNRNTNIWIEGGLIQVSHVSSADSLNGVTLTNPGLEGRYSGKLFESVIVGDTANIGETTLASGVEYPRSLPITWRPSSPHSGITLWKGPIKAQDLWFDGFYQNKVYDQGAISFRRNQPYFFPANNDLMNLTFAFDDGPKLGNRFISGAEANGWTVRDGDKTAAWRAVVLGEPLVPATKSPAPAHGVEPVGDIVGCLINLTPQEHEFIVKPDLLQAAGETCTHRENWRMARCPRADYGNFKVFGNGTERNVTFVRDDLPAAQLELDLHVSTGPAVVLNGSVAYTAHHTGPIPAVVRLKGLGVERNKWFRGGLCIPLDAEYELHSWMPWTPGKAAFHEMNSTAQLDADDEYEGSKFYHDRTSGVIWFKFSSKLVKCANEVNQCPRGLCPHYMITILSGNLSDSDCRERLYGDALTEPLPTLLPDTEIIPRNADTVPPQGWGAGSTRPFIGRKSVSGGWSKWSGWGACSQTCGVGEQYRTRECNRPLPTNVGPTCVGSAVETRACEILKCPIDGKFSDWTEWTDCMSTSCSGYQERKRGCDNPAPNYNGDFCDGYTAEMKKCFLSGC